MKIGPKEVAEAMAAEGVEGDVIKRVLLNLGFSQEEAVRAAARACIGIVSLSRGGGQAQSQQRGESSTIAKREEGVPNIRELQRRVLTLEGRVAALINLLSDYVPDIAEKIKSKEVNDGEVRSFM
ncbi:MAG: hypothetical protein N3H31_02710 [Candidatus Nezhaarchaeota archaeon]|nr:hypothetical protein [Candidatus Nezhaarchaeota archaeon]